MEVMSEKNHNKLKRIALK